MFKHSLLELNQTNPDYIIYNPKSYYLDRNPAHYSIGSFDKNKMQRLSFSESKELMSNDDVGLGHLKRQDVAIYPSWTNNINGHDIFLVL